MGLGEVLDGSDSSEELEELAPVELELEEVEPEELELVELELEDDPGRGLNQLRGQRSQKR